MAQSARWFVDVSQEALGGMAARTEPIFEQFVEETGGLEGADIFFAQLAYGLAPEPLPLDYLLRRGPYRNPESLRAEVDAAVGRGWLEVAGDGHYELTSKGKEVVDRLFALFDQVYRDFESLPDADLERIAALLRKVVQRAGELAEPAEKLALALARRFDRGPSAPAIVQARRSILDLRAYRDDVHIAAWRPYGVSGHIWETLTLAWRGEAATAAEFADELSFRGYDEGAYAAALEDLVARGWVAKEDGRYRVTDEGKRLRQEAEDATDRYFDAPWAVLSEAEMTEVKGLLGKLAEVLTPDEEPA